MGWNSPAVTYKGYRAGDELEIVVKRQGQPSRLLDSPTCQAEWAMRMLTDYLGDEARAADVHNDFSALAIRRLTGDWELTGNDIDNVLSEVEILRARMRIALARA